MVSKNSELQTHESKLPVIGNDELKLHQATDEPKIIHLSVETLKEVLRLCMVKVGLRGANFPNDFDKAILLHHIAVNYGNHTAGEIKLAFDMSIAGKLDCDPNCFENFSCLYFSNIMNAYRLWAKEAMKMKKESVKELPAPPPELQDAEMMAWLQDVKEKFNYGEYDFNILPVILYEYALNKGLITGNKKAAWQKAKAIRLERINAELMVQGCNFTNLHDSKNYITSGGKSVTHPEYSTLTTLAKRLMLVEWMDC